MIQHLSVFVRFQPKATVQHNVFIMVNNKTLKRQMVQNLGFGDVSAKS